MIDSVYEDVNTRSITRLLQFEDFNAISHGRRALVIAINVEVVVSFLTFDVTHACTCILVYSALLYICHNFRKPNGHYRLDGVYLFGRPLHQIFGR